MAECLSAKQKKSSLKQKDRSQTTRPSEGAAFFYKEFLLYGRVVFNLIE